MQRYLVLCMANLLRSPYIEKKWDRMFRERNMDAQVSSAGVSTYTVSEGRQPVQATKEMLESADRLFVADRRVEEMVELVFGDYRKKTAVLGIPDIYRSRIEDKILEGMTPGQAVGYFNSRIHDPSFRIGTRLFDMVVEGKFEELFFPYNLNKISV